jgi:hypothetical protein
VRAGAAWLVLLTVWAPAVAGLGAAHASGTAFLAVAAPLGAVAVVATLLFGGWLGRGAAWRQLALASLVGTVALLAWYDVLMFAFPGPGSDGNAAGAGTVIFAVPALLALALLLASGGWAGRTFARRAPA